MEKLHLNYKNSRVSYLRFGAGPRVAVCIHGYGENAASFSFLNEEAGRAFTFYAIDLPFHGHTEWREGLNMTAEDICAIIDQMLSSQGRTGAAEEPMTLIGFSLGGRVALTVFQHIPRRIEKLVLIAPDGLKLNFWYWFATQTMAGRSLFRFTMQHPGWFFTLLKGLNRLGIVNSSIFKFVNHYIGNAGVRKALFDRWITLRRLRPSVPVIKTLIAEQATPTRLLYGRHDRIILSVRGEKFSRNIESCCRIAIIESGHQVLHTRHAADIIPALLQ